MLGERLKTLRIENNLTQKDLAEKLYVTAQAVSRWEKNEVEPSITTLTAIAKVFNISVGELLGEEKQQGEAEMVKEIETIKEEIENIKEKEESPRPQAEPARPVLAVCECCNTPIYDGDEIVRKTEYNGDSTVKKVICKTCDKKQREKAFKDKVHYGVKQRKKSFLWGGIFSGLIALVFILATNALDLPIGTVLLNGLFGASFFPLISCLYLKNNFIEELMDTIAGWSIRFPGLIFTLDLDGIIWFITVKLMFGILSFLISAAAFVLSIFVAQIISLFVYPFALIKSIKAPHLSSEF